MWLVVSLIAALASSAACFLISSRKKELGLLSLMLWGTAIMVFVDRLIASLEGEPFLSATTDGLISDSALLGIAMLIPIFILWGLIAFTPLSGRATQA